VRVALHERGELTDVSIRLHPYGTEVTQYLLGLNEHDVRDLEFELARRRAMAKRCTSVRGEHTCSLAPGHLDDPGHLCRACTETWPVVPEEGS
jgi:hypothetical protein